MKRRLSPPAAGMALTRCYCDWLAGIGIAARICRRPAHSHRNPGTRQLPRTPRSRTCSARRSLAASGYESREPPRTTTHSCSLCSGTTTSRRFCARFRWRLFRRSSRLASCGQHLPPGKLCSAAAGLPTRRARSAEPNAAQAQTQGSVRAKGAKWQIEPQRRSARIRSHIGQTLARRGDRRHARRSMGLRAWSLVLGEQNRGAALRRRQAFCGARDPLSRRSECAKECAIGDAR